MHETLEQELLTRLNNHYNEVVAQGVNPQYDFIMNYIKKNKIDVSYKTFCEFGIYCGDSMVYTCDLMRKHNIFPYNYLGFDSFVGLPETGITATPEQVALGYWVKGQFNVQSALGVFNNEDIKQLILKRIGSIETNIEIIDGFFNESLGQSIVDKISEIFWLNIDSDIYGSARDVLDFVCQNKLLGDGSIISYDNFGFDGDRHLFKENESLAHKEAEEKYKIKCKKIGCNNSSCAVYLIQSIG